MLEQRFIRSVVSTSGLSAIAQGMGFVRQMLIASLYGISRELDVFWVCFAMASLLVITPGTVFESVCMPFLVRAREQGDGVQRLAASIFKLSILLGLGLAMLLVVGVFLLGGVFAAGFSPEERLAVNALAWWFIPLALIFLPYSALSAIHKSSWSFTRVFAVEGVVVITSVLVLYFGSEVSEILPLSYFAGYVVGGCLLLPASGLLQGWATGPLAGSWQVLRQSGHVVLANQIGSLSSFVDRYFQSLLLPGGISALSYVSQLVVGLAGALSLRDIFVVPLAETENRALKLEKLLSALLLLSIPLVGAVELLAPEIIHLWLERGRFDAEAANLSVQVLQIFVLTLAPSVLAAPMFRIFQIVQKVRFTYLGYFCSFVFMSVFGWIFVSWLGLDAQGVALTLVCNSWLTCGVAALLMPWCGIHLNWAKVVRYGMVALVAAGLGWAVASIASENLGGAWVRLLVGGGVYTAVVLVAYLMRANFLRQLLK